MLPPRQAQPRRRPPLVNLRLPSLTTALKHAIISHINAGESTRYQNEDYDGIIADEDAGFSRLRSAHGVSLADLLSSLETGDLLDPVGPVNEGTVPGFGGGLSGSHFVVTADHRFVLKTLLTETGEHSRIRALIPALATYLEKRNSIVVRQY